MSNDELKARALAAIQAYATDSSVPLRDTYEGLNELAGELNSHIAATRDCLEDEDDD